jgi:flavin-dependent thymidylate synthase
MRITLINQTSDAAELLIFTKETRLQMSPDGLAAIKAWPEERKLEALSYMSRTIPSSWEFVDYVFMVEGVTRAYTHQQVRTRTGTYAQQTMRKLNVNENGRFKYRTGPSFNTQEPGKRHNAAVAKAKYEQAMMMIADTYGEILSLGIEAEDARGLLPTNIETNIVVKFNLRTMSDIAKSRTGGRTQDEYREVVDGMVNAVLAVHPWAEAFLFPRGRDAWKRLEELAAEVRKLNDKLGWDLLKEIDILRKEG